jgi:hypothetical protein
MEVYEELHKSYFTRNTGIFSMTEIKSKVDARARARL